MKNIKMIFVLSLLLMSCKKEDSGVTPISQTESLSDYFPMTVGSYWIYKVYGADTSLTFTENGVDTVFVDKDSTVNGISYKVFRGPFYNISLLRDSAGIIVNSDGGRIFSLNTELPFINNDYLVDSMYHSTSTLSNSDSTFLVPAGSFTAKHINGKITYKFNEPQYLKVRYYKSAYSKNVGLVYKRTMYLNGPGYLEFKLLQYKIK